jgi:putative ABC transport system permease protein
MALFDGKIPLARRMLIHRKGRLVMSMLGIAFSVIIMFMEIGFFNGINDSQANLPPHLDADLLILSQRRYALVDSSTFRRIRLQQALAVDGVIEATPSTRAPGWWSTPRTNGSGRSPSSPSARQDEPLAVPGLDRYLEALRIKGTWSSMPSLATSTATSGQARS